MIHTKKSKSVLKLYKGLHILSRHSRQFVEGLLGASVVEPEPVLEQPQGAGTFGRSLYTEVSASAPCPTKVVY